MGFEPTMGKPNGFAIRSLRPLGHTAVLSRRLVDRRTDGRRADARGDAPAGDRYPAAMPRSLCRTLLLIPSLLASPLCAQPASPDAPTPTERDAVERRIDRLERSARDFAPAKPSERADVQTAGPGAERNARVAPDPMAGARGGDLREGASVVDVRGRVALTPGGWVFAADPVRDNEPRVLLRLLPSPTSQRLREIVAERDASGAPPATFRVSGRVLVDRGHVYLLPLFATAVEPVESKPGERTELAEDEAPAQVDERVSTPDDPSVRDLLERVERASEADRGGVREEFVGGMEGSTPGVRLLAGRVARLGRLPNGRLAFRFEAGTDSNTADAIDRAVVLPCRLHQALEQVWASRGDDARLLVSGEAFRDAGRWYILPSLVEVERGAPSGLRTLR